MSKIYLKKVDQTELCEHEYGWCYFLDKNSNGKCYCRGNDKKYPCGNKCFIEVKKDETNNA